MKMIKKYVTSNWKINQAENKLLKKEKIIGTGQIG